MSDKENNNGGRVEGEPVEVDTVEEVRHDSTC